MDWHTRRDVPAFTDFGADDGVSDSGAIAVTSAASAKTLGSIVEIISSVPEQCHGFLLHIGPRSSTAGSGSRVQLYIGAAASEQVILDGIILDTLSEQFRVATHYMPYGLPKGERISAAVSDNTTLQISCDVSITCLSGSLFPSAPFNHMEGWHWDSGGFGAAVDPGATANQKGAWEEVTSAVSHHVRAIGMSYGPQTNALSNANWLWDLGRGAAGSEVVVLPNMRASVGLSKDTVMPGTAGPFPVFIPSGERIAIRAQCSITDATDRLFRPAFIFYT